MRGGDNMDRKKLKEWIIDALYAVECGHPVSEFVSKLDEVIGEEKTVYNPGDVITSSKRGPHGRIVVAVVGYDNDFAAYEQATPYQNTVVAIAAGGDKLSREHAVSLFPDIQLHYRE